MKSIEGDDTEANIDWLGSLRLIRQGKMEEYKIKSMRLYIEFEDQESYEEEKEN